MAKVGSNQFVSKDEKIKFTAYYCEESIWLAIDDISLMFEKDKSEIQQAINRFKQNNRQKSKMVSKTFTISENVKVRTTQEAYNLKCIELLGKKYKNKYFKEFDNWAYSALIKLKISSKSIDREIKMMKGKYINNFAFVIMSLVFSAMYLWFNVNRSNLTDVYLTLFGINYAIIAFNIPSLISIVKTNKEEMKNLSKSKFVFDNKDAKILYQITKMLINEMLISIVLAIACILCALIFNLSLLWKNALSIFSLMLSMLYLLHIVLQIYGQQKCDLDTSRKEDKNSEKQIEEEINKWIK